MLRQFLRFDIRRHPGPMISFGFGRHHPWVSRNASLLWDELAMTVQIIGPSGEVFAAGTAQDMKTGEHHPRGLLMMRF